MEGLRGVFTPISYVASIFRKFLVIVTDRPTFKWETAPAATSYRVYVNDLAGQVIKRSDELPSETTEWKVTQALKRGEVYAWTVVAVIDGKEVVSPGSDAPEMKFHVLSIRSLEQLNTLKKTRSNLALEFSTRTLA